MTRVVVTGLGLVSPLGVGVKQAWNRLIAGKSGIVALDERFDALSCRVGGVVPQDEWSEASSANLAAGEIKRVPLFAQYAMVAAQEAVNDSKLLADAGESAKHTDIGCSIGTGIANMAELADTVTAFNNKGPRGISPLFVPRIIANMGAGHVSMRFGLQGPNHSVSTACATGAHSIGDAANFIRLGYAKAMIAGSTEACMHPIALGGFARAKSVATKWNDSPSEASRPFDKDRGGFVMGEGSAVLVLEEYEHAVARGAPIYAEVCGYGLSGDAHHITAPPDDGNGAYRAMKQALKQANVSAVKIDYVNAHATSTPLGDAAENAALTQLFEGRNLSDIAVSSTKGAIGHLLGGAGSVEALFTIKALETGDLPPTLNLNELSDPDVFKFNFVPKETQHRDVRYALNNSFGFGGTNSSLLFGKV
ncbi:YALI0F30679p [Yarrowia lipolytica CLIB122]|uniref:3-oxoacyl-[acyl-carrier-protein] synthase n=2 Tax=Yarrowia lipolytica TaxID=4952 RepID=Q6BZV1_YARLI|nr:YALI0F30679p [Yarrowia lipolytica CLIB122]AOW07921.1 hypothetical protein YALI1_F38317g [Yarrowia lipolytica]KAB8282311.1 thiolase-like protein [Yarrowia lipolytica]KAE8172303.1 thiolase-like protein [Yarrowia lipolytica]KAJ8055045.1 thiolase-like protein [Yarrowia lipolytica]RMI99823.1 thiolase-like protein [Yarrowia lipolytica]|eukprot:XP_506061.1 YALI0F30679p [Yarrowia lipolytica CLIB122]